MAQAKLKQEERERIDAIVGKIKGEYQPTWPSSPNAIDLASRVTHLYSITNIGCKAYYQEKADVIYVMARNALAQFEQEKNSEGRSTIRILDDLTQHLNERELVEIARHSNGRVTFKDPL